MSEYNYYLHFLHSNFHSEAMVLFINIMIAYLLRIIILEKRLCLAISHYLSHLAHHLLILLVKSHLQLYPCPLQINYLLEDIIIQIYFGSIGHSTDGYLPELIQHLPIE